MFACGSLRPGCDTSGTWQWTCDGETVASVGYRAKLGDDGGTLTLDYSTERDGEGNAITCTITLESLPCNYGGRRWYMLCPYTGRRALKLY
ncbi:MAG: hypothetical protein ACREPS_10320, partial [Rhodanobacteraceae bacterium]